MQGIVYDGRTVAGIQKRGSEQTSHPLFCIPATVLALQKGLTVS